MRLILHIFTFYFFFLVNVFSQEQDKTKETTESWYTYWGIGVASADYPNHSQDEMDYLHEQGDITNFAVTYDILGIYFHLSQDILVGVVLNGIVDRYKVDDNNWLQIEQYAAGISGMYFTGKSFGSGLFFRADLSLAFLNISYSEDAGTWSSEEPGIGLLLGTGWSFDLGRT